MWLLNYPKLKLLTHICCVLVQPLPTEGQEKEPAAAPPTTVLDAKSPRACQHVALSVTHQRLQRALLKLAFTARVAAQHC
jgi:hypothetical protein